jgi:uncharacterized membrane protein YdjX (TVP38/TMEM64 family)
MKTKQFVIASFIMAAIYLVVSFAVSKLFGREFNWVNRSLSALAFGILITVFQIFWEKNKEKRKKRR